MTEKELKRLSRMDLLEMLIDVSKEKHELEAQVQALQEKLKEREIALEKVGSIAEASLVLNNVFEAAQKAADQYLENVKRIADKG